MRTDPGDASTQSGLTHSPLSATPCTKGENVNGHPVDVVWFTGLSGAGKSTLANLVAASLRASGYRTFLVDGDQLRQGLCSDLGFSAADRRENLRRAAQVCKLFVDAGVIVLAAFVSPSRSDRAMVRTLLTGRNFVEVYCAAPLAICEQRDVKGLYAQARRGEIASFTGISSPYEPPEVADLVVDTGRASAAESMAQVMSFLIPL